MLSINNDHRQQFADALSHSPQQLLVRDFITKIHNHYRDPRGSLWSQERDIEHPLQALREEYGVVDIRVERNARDRKVVYAFKFADGSWTVFELDDLIA